MAGGIESGLVQGRSVGWYSFHGNGRGEYGFGTEAQAVVTVTAGTAQAVLKVDQKGTETPPVTGTTFKITLGEPTPTGVNMKVVPSDNDAVYYYDVLSKQILDQHHSGDLAVYMKNMMAEAVKNYGSVEEALKKLGSQGESNYAFEGLDPNTDYLAFAAGLDAAGEVNTAIEKTTFKTKELAAGATFKVEFTCYYNGADFTITPSDLEFPYYSAIRPAFRYQGLDDDALLQTIIAEDSFMLDFMAAPGVYEYKNEGVYLPDTEYWVLIFGWAASAPTTPIQKFPFRTSKPNIDPAACQFTVTHSDLTSRGMNISIKPSDDTVPYMFDLISEADYERYKADMKAYVTEYVGQDIDNLDNNRVCGQSGYSYTKVLEPGTKYYVWVASIDEFGKPQADVYISDPITTLPKAVSDATVTATIDKYFNGDDLYALDNEKYADCRGAGLCHGDFCGRECEGVVRNDGRRGSERSDQCDSRRRGYRNVIGRRYVVSYRQALPVQMGYGAYDSGRRCRCGRESGRTVAPEPYLHQGGRGSRFRIRGT